MSANPSQGAQTPCNEQEEIVSYTGAWCTQNCITSQSSSNSMVRWAFDLCLDANLRQMLYTLRQIRLYKLRQLTPTCKVPLKPQTLKLLNIKMERLWNPLIYRCGFSKQPKKNPGMGINVQTLRVISWMTPMIRPAKDQRLVPRNIMILYLA